MNQEKIGKFIKELRKNNNMTQSQFAQKYNVTYQAVSNWEQGKNIPDVSLLKQISKDFNVSLDDLFAGKHVKKRHFYTLIFLFLILLIIALIFLLKNNSTYEFKTLSSSCSNFNISGSLSYDETKTSIFINKIDYCGGNDEVKYQNIECILYESNDNAEIKISTCNYEKNEAIKLEDYLKNVEFKISDYLQACNTYTNESLFLRINATDEDGKVTTYKIPLSLDDCD